MTRLQMQGAMHPTGLFYTTRTMRQEIERIFGGWKEYNDEPVWKVKGGYVHPFKDYGAVFQTPEELKAWSDDLDLKAEDLFKNANVVVATLGLIEGWMQPRNGNHYRQIPHPEIFPTLGAKFTRLTVADMIEDLRVIRELLQKHTSAKLVLTVSPIPLHATMLDRDIRVANTESKARIRAAVSEFIDQYPDVHYFHSYEMVTTAERASDYMLEDGRHVNRQAVDFILAEFLSQVAGPGVPVPQIDISWLTPPSQKAERVAHRWTQNYPALDRTLVRVWRSLPSDIRSVIKQVRPR
ncbi:MAG: GSCFA domain-containing protein [Sandaracinaceae bacterium]|nr:GSCFA domain-containing protein [Sandaracinaceae bacterium]